MKSLGNGEFCHNDTFVFNFEPKQSILDYIPDIETPFTNNLTYHELRNLIIISANKLNSLPNESIYSNTTGKDFLIISIAGLLSNKAVLTHEEMIMDETLIITSCDEFINDDRHNDKISFPQSINNGYILFFTSGSTGKPKLIKLTQLNIITGALGCLKDELQVLPNDKVLLCLPTYHIYEFIMELMFAFSGAELIYSTPQTLYQTYSYMHPSIMVVVPQILNNFYERSLQLKLRVLISGGAPIRNKVYEFFSETCNIIANGYGSTETSASIAVSTDSTTNGTCTRSVIVKLSETSELLVKGPSVSDSAKLDEFGWYHTKDIVEITENNMIKLIGRNCNVIKLQQGEFINLDELSEIYSEFFTTTVFADSTDRYPNAIVYIPNNRMKEEDIRKVLNDIHMKNNLKGFERIDNIIIIDDDK